MKKLSLLLIALFLCVPVFAGTVTITATYTDDTENMLFFAQSNGYTGQITEEQNVQVGTDESGNPVYELQNVTRDITLTEWLNKYSERILMNIFTAPINSFVQEQAEAQIKDAQKQYYDQIKAGLTVNVEESEE